MPEVTYSAKLSFLRGGGGRGGEEVFKIFRKGEESYVGGLDNPLENMKTIFK